MFDSIVHPQNRPPTNHFNLYYNDTITDGNCDYRDTYARKYNKSISITQEMDIDTLNSIGLSELDELQQYHNIQENIDVNILQKIKKMYNSLIDRYDTIFSTNNVNSDDEYETIMSNYPGKNYKYPVHRYNTIYEYDGSQEYDLKNDDVNSVFKDFIEQTDTLNFNNNIGADINNKNLVDESVERARENLQQLQNEALAAAEAHRDATDTTTQRATAEAAAAATEAAFAAAEALDRQVLEAADPNSYSKILSEISSYKIINIIDELLYIELNRPNDPDQKTCKDNIKILNELKYIILKLNIEMKAEIDNLKAIIMAKSDEYFVFDFNRGKLRLNQYLINEDNKTFIDITPIDGVYASYQTYIQSLEEEEQQNITKEHFIDDLFVNMFDDSSEERRNELYRYLRNAYGETIITRRQNVALPLDERSFYIILNHYRRIRMSDIEYPLREIDFPHSPCSIQTQINVMISDYDLCIAVPSSQNLKPPNWDISQEASTEGCDNLVAVCETNYSCGDISVLDCDSR